MNLDEKSGSGASKIPEKYAKTLRSAINILDYADNSERKLREKLTRKGYEADGVDFVVEYLKEIGILDDQKAMWRVIEHYAYSCLYGKQRISALLFTKGYKREDILAADWDEIDFVEICAKCRRKIARRYADPQKLYAALRRYGFSNSEIKDSQ